MALIDIGTAATSRSSPILGATQCGIEYGNPANDTGLLDVFQIQYRTNGTTASRIGTLYGTAPDFTGRDYEDLGAVSAGSIQTFSGKNCVVSSGDYVGVCSAGTGDGLGGDTSGGTNCYYGSLSNMWDSASHTYSAGGAGLYLALYATGHSGFIDIGYGAVDGNTYNGAGSTWVDKNKPSNNTGILDIFEFWFNTSATGVVSGTWSGSTPNLTARDWEAIGNVTGGSKQTFSGKSCSVSSGDLLGIYHDTGTLDMNSTGGLAWYDSYPTNANWHDGNSHSFRDLSASTYPYWMGMRAVGAISNVVDIGRGATSLSQHGANTNTNIATENPANNSGVLDTFEMYVYSSATGVKMGTFTGSSTSYTINDYETIGDISSGSKQTFTGKNCNVTAGDFLGTRLGTGELYFQNGGGNYYYYSGDAFSGGTQTYTLDGTQVNGFATGINLVAPTVTTQSASSVAYSTLTGNGTVVVGYTPALTERGVCYKSGTGQTPTTSDSTAHDHTDASGAFTESVTGLLELTTYSIRAYAINSAGTGYGSVVEATTLGAPVMTKQYLGFRGHVGNGSKGIAK